MPAYFLRFRLPKKSTSPATSPAPATAAICLPTRSRLHQKAERALREGACVIVYPEGTASRDPDLWPMVGKTGAARLALTTGAPVVPIGQWGAQEILPYGTKKLHLFPRKTVRMVAGPPVDLSAYAGQRLAASTLQAATADIMAAITALLATIRHETPPAVPWDPDAGGRPAELDRTDRGTPT